MFDIVVCRAVFDYRIFNEMKWFELNAMLVQIDMLAKDVGCRPPHVSQIIVPFTPHSSQPYRKMPFYVLFLFSQFTVNAIPMCYSFTWAQFTLNPNLQWASKKKKWQRQQNKSYLHNTCMRICFTIHCFNLRMKSKEWRKKNSASTSNK